MPSLASIDAELLDPGFKGFPLDHPPFSVGQAGQQQLNLLRGDLPFPCAVLRDRAMTHNSQWYAAFARELDIDFAPHGKTTMAPQIFARQMHDGAWGITVGTVQQGWIALDGGVKRLLLANQIASPGEARRWLSMMERYKDSRLISLLDSSAQLEMLCKAYEDWAAAHGEKPPQFEVMIELGRTGGRTGCRSVDEALALTLQARKESAVKLVGVEAYEGLAATGDSVKDDAMVKAWMQSLVELVMAIEQAGGWDLDEIIISAGGSSVFDLVARALTEARSQLEISRKIRIILRSGCYITHDDGHYQRLQQSMEARALTKTIREGLSLSCCDHEAIRSTWRVSSQGGLMPALEVWACVQSRPEPGLALVTMGRRDAGFDSGLPKPVLVLRDGQLTEAPAHWKLQAMNDQHAYLLLSNEDRLRVGDLIGFGISHPCTTFDKWRLLWVIDDHYNVRAAIRSYF